VAGNVETAAKFLDYPLFRKEPERGQRAVIADAGVTVFDDVVVMLEVDDTKRQQKRRYQFESAAEMIDVAGLRQRDQRLDGDRRRDLLERAELQRLVVGKTAAVQIPGEGQHVRLDAVAKQRGFSEEGRVAAALFGHNRCERIHRA
jgi:hypothetical protein